MKAGPNALPRWLPTIVIALTVIGMKGAGAFNFGFEASRSCSIENALTESKTRADVVLSVPFLDAYPHEMPGRPGGAEPQPVYRGVPTALLISSLRRELEAGPTPCGLCSITILVPAEPIELSSRGGVSEYDSQRYAAAQREWEAEAPRFAAGRSICGSSTVQIEFRTFFPAARTIDSWLRAVLLSASRLHCDGGSAARRVVAFREITVGPAVSFGQWINALGTAAATEGTVVGCPVYEFRRATWHSYGYKPRIYPDYGPALVRSRSGYRGLPPEGNTTFAVPPACFALPTDEFLAVATQVAAERRPDSSLNDVKSAFASLMMAAGSHRYFLMLLSNFLQTAEERMSGVTGFSDDHVVAPNGGDGGGGGARGSTASDENAAAPSPAYRQHLKNMLLRLHRLQMRSQTLLEETESIPRRYAAVAEATRAHRQVAIAIGRNTRKATPGDFSSHSHILDTVDMKFKQSLQHDLPCYDQRVRQWFVENVTKVSAPCVMRRGSKIVFCGDGKLMFERFAPLYRGSLQADTMDTADLPSVVLLEDYAEAALTALNAVREFVNNRTLPKAALTCELTAVTAAPGEQAQAASQALPSATVSREARATVSQCHHRIRAAVRQLQAIIDSFSAGAAESAKIVAQARARLYASCPARQVGSTFAVLLQTLADRGKRCVMAQNAVVEMADLRLRLADVGVSNDPSAGINAAMPRSLQLRSLMYLDNIPLLSREAMGEAAAVSEAGSTPLSSSLADLAVTEVQKKRLTNGLRMLWTTPCCECCGFSVETVWVLLGVDRYVEALSPQAPECHCDAMPASVTEQLLSMFVSPKPTIGPIHPSLFGGDREKVNVVVHHWDPINAEKFYQVTDMFNAHYVIIRCMFEMDGIPQAWMPKVKAPDIYDEIWVPTNELKASFVRAGVPDSKIQVMHEPVDTQFFDPANTEHIQLPMEIYKRRWRTSSIGGVRNGRKRTDEELAKNFKFLSVFKMEPRKGWDALLKAYFEAFDAGSDVSLYLVTYFFETGNAPLPRTVSSPRDADFVRWKMETTVAEALGRFKPEDYPHVVIITEPVSDDEMLQLYRSVDGFVLPSRGEGWGLPIIQAMSMGLPTITTRHSGMLEFTKPDTVLYVNVDIVEPPRQAQIDYGAPPGAKWGEPSVESLRGQLTKIVFDMNREARAALGRRARDDVVARFSVDVIGRKVAERLVAIEDVVRRRWRDEQAAVNATDFESPLV